MTRRAENVATVVAVLAAAVTLISAAGPGWLPSQDLPPAAYCADALGQVLDRLLDGLLRLAAWIRPAFEPSRSAPP